MVKTKAAGPDSDKQSFLLPGLWLAHTASVLYLYWPLIPQACDFLGSSVSLGEILQTMSQAQYYYLYLSLPLNIFLLTRIRKSHEFEVMKFRLWTRKNLPGLGWVLGAILVAAVFLCSFNQNGG